MYMVLKGLKTDITWKALFVTVGAALIVMVIRSALCLVATAALPNVYYPFDLRIGLSIAPYNVIAYPSQVTGGLSTEALAAFYNIEAATATFRAISLFLFGACYVWFGILCTFTIGALKPELSMPKRILAAAVAIIITVLILLFFLTNYA
jgi:hypothetical protein